MRRLLPAVAISLCLAHSPAAADTLNTPECRQALAATWESLQDALSRLRIVSRASQGDKCAAFRSHAGIIGQAREVFARCKTGRDREGDLAQMDGALDDVTSTIARECQSR